MEITALGVYVAELNGTRVGDFVLAPGWTSYEHRLQVQTYDVTELLTEENELHVTVGKGWFRSPIPGWEDSEDKRRRVSQPCGLIAALTLCYKDGSSETIGTDASWDVGESSVRFSEIYDGERCDATFETQEWEQASLLDWSKEILIPQEGEVLDTDGNFYNANYCSAKAEVEYICREGKQRWHPVLTFFDWLREPTPSGRDMNKNDKALRLIAGGLIAL